MIDFKDLRYRLEYAVFRLLELAILATPLETASSGSGTAWRLIAPHLHRQKRVLDNLAAAYPETSPGERKRIAADMWENLGRTYAEFFHLDRIVAEGRIALEPFERFEKIAHGGPFVVCGLHLGNWEIMSQAGKRFGVPLTARLPAAQQSLCRRRDRKIARPAIRGRAPAQDAGNGADAS